MSSLQPCLWPLMSVQTTRSRHRENDAASILGPSLMLISILAFVSILTALTLISVLWRRHAFHPATFFLLLATVDVFFPAIYWMLNGQVDNPEWLPLLNEEKILA